MNTSLMTSDEVDEDRLRQAFWNDARKSFGGSIPHDVAMNIAFKPIDDLIDWTFDNCGARCFALDMGDGDEIVIFDGRKAGHS